MGRPGTPPPSALLGLASEYAVWKYQENVASQDDNNFQK
jgi:hypothetical protein